MKTYPCYWCYEPVQIKQSWYDWWYGFRPTGRKHGSQAIMHFECIEALDRIIIKIEKENKSSIFPQLSKLRHSRGKEI